MKIDNIFFKFLIVISILLTMILVSRNVNEMFQGNQNTETVSVIVENTPEVTSTSTTTINREAVKKANIDYCNNLNPLNCDLERCVYSRIESKCKAIDDNLFSDSDNLEQFYRDTMVYHGLDKNRVREIIEPTPYLNLLDLFEFGGTDNPGYIFITEFYGNNTSMGMFFSFNEFTSETMPLITTDNWSVYIRKTTELEEEIYYLEFAFRDYFQTFSHSAKLKPGDPFYFFGITLTRKTLTLYLMNTALINSDDYLTRYRNGEVYNLNDEILKNVDTRTTTIFIGCNLTRNKFFHGFIGKFNISRDQKTINDLRRLSLFFSKEILNVDLLDKGESLDELLIDTTRDNRIPSRISVSGTLHDNTLDLHWLSPEIGSESLNTYIIIMISDKTDVKYLFHKNTNCNTCSKKINDLEYGKTYLINIIGVNDNGIGLIRVDDFMTVEVSSNEPLSNASLTGFSKNPDKISCNPDGSFNVGKSCFSKEAIEADIDMNVHELLTEHLNSRPSYNLQPKIELVK